MIFLFEKTDEDPMTVAITLTALSQDTSHNVIVLNEKVSQDELNKNKLKDEIINLKEDMSKRRKMECDMTLLK